MSEAARPMAELIEEYRRTKKKADLVRLLVPLVIIGVFVVFIFVIYGRVKAFDVDTFTDQIGEKAVKLAPRVSETMMAVGEEVLPVFADEFEKQLDGAFASMSTTLEHEVDLLQKNLSGHLTAKLEGFTGGAAERHRKLVIQHFPQFKDDGAKVYEITRAVDGAFEKWFFDQINGVFNRHIKALAAIHDTAQDLRKSALKEGKGKRSINAEQVLGLWMEVVNGKLEADTSEKAKPLPKRQPKSQPKAK